VEQALLQRIKQGDERAFAELYRLYAEYALRVAAAVTKSRVSAMDAVQETFLRVYRHIESFDVQKPFKPWFYRILINECKRFLEQGSGVVLVSDFTANGLEAAQRDNYRFEEYTELYAAIAALEEHQRIPIVLKYLEDFTEQEIAEILELNVNTVKSRLFKGRQKLKKIMEQQTERRERHGG